MRRNLFAVLVTSAICVAAAADPPRLEAQNPSPVSALVGGWSISFANGVVEVCDVRADGKAAVSEPNRTSPGQVEIRDGQAVIVFDDGRVERWTVVGDKRVVEHFFPADQFPNGPRVLGIAERVK